MKENKTCTYQTRCTKNEKELIERRIAKSGMKRSDYMRTVLIAYSGKKEENVQFAVKAQELLNYLEEHDMMKCKAIGRMVDELWELL